MKSLQEYSKLTTRDNAGPQTQNHIAPPALQHPNASRTYHETNGLARPAGRSATAGSQETNAKPSDDSLPNVSRHAQASGRLFRRTVPREPEVISISDTVNGGSSALDKGKPAAPSVACNSTEESLSSIPTSLEECSTRDYDDNASAHGRNISTLSDAPILILNAAEFKSPNGHWHLNETTEDSGDSPLAQFHDLLSEAADLVLGPRC
jgi:hypothetical protein